MRRILVEVTNLSLQWPQSSGGRLASITTPNCNYYTKDKSAILNKYYAENVPVDREKSELISREVLPLVESLLIEINAQDERFGKEIIRVGSSTQGLSVNTNGDYDFSVIFKLDPSEDVNQPPTQLCWSDRNEASMKYGFEDSEENETTSLRRNLKIVRKSTSLPHPGFGYSTIPLQWPLSDFDDSDFDYSDFDYSDFDNSNFDYSDFDDSDFNESDFDSLQFDGDLIPHLVKCRFKGLLQDALEKLQLKEYFKLSRDAHGPALTLRTEVATEDNKRHSVSIDLAIIIRAGLEFHPEMGWPVPEEPLPWYYRSSTAPDKINWPPPDKVEAILAKGINIVAKKPFFWYVSFVELEKMLVSEIDQDGGCRKKVHRIMKSVFYNVCKEKPVLTSYMLKNVWFLECEKYPHTESWQPDNLAVMYCKCLESLREYVCQARLPQYFNRSVNLLENKDVAEDVQKIIRFDFEKVVSYRKREADEWSLLQPPHKIPRA